MPAPAPAHTAMPADVEQSRRALIDAIGEAPHLTFVRGPGNLGDELIREGTRRLLEGHVYSEITIDELPSTRGGTALLVGGGAWSRVYHEFMPCALAVAELRFDRVIVLPSTFEVEEDSVRDALRRTRATVFAREPLSYRRITPLCRARLAHDCAFFYDFTGGCAPGEGTLNAFRTDPERPSLAPLPEDNVDISVALPDLDAWLTAIERHATVRTDRAHVMIAAALMGKEVEYAPPSSFKAALADGLPVRIIERPADPLPEPEDDPRTEATRRRLRAAARPAPAPGPAPRVTALVLSRDRPAQVVAAVRSVLSSSPLARVLVVDNNSGPRTRAALAALGAAEPAVRLHLSDRNLGCAGGRRLGTELADTEFVLFLDDDAELLPGALEHLTADLDAHPQALATTALVVNRGGTVEHFGGWIERTSELVRFTLDGRGRRFDDPDLPATGASGWIPGTAALVRTETFARFPIDPGMAAYFEDNEWSYRVEREAPGSFRRCREAVAFHDSCPLPEPSAGLHRYVAAAERLAASAYFLARHDVVLEEQLFLHLPELRRPDGSHDVAAARLLLELLAARGTDWFVAEWASGGLDPLLDGANGEGARLGEELATAQRKLNDAERDAAQLGKVLAATNAELQRSQAAWAMADEWHERLKVRDAEHEEWLERIARLEAERAAEAEHVEWLTERHETLVRVEGGGWWALRNRLLPALRLAGRVRAGLGRLRR